MSQRGLKRGDLASQDVPAAFSNCFDSEMHVLADFLPLPLKIVRSDHDEARTNRLKMS